MTHWNKLFKSLGFSESESAIYLTALEMGPSPVQDIAKKAKVSRVTAYAVIEGLMKNGLMSTIDKGKKKLYVAESPERLLSYMQSRMKQMEATLSEVQSVISELKLMQGGERPVVKMFEGGEGIKAILEDMVTTAADTVYEIGNLASISTVLSSEDLAPYKAKLSKRKMKSVSFYLADDSFKPRGHSTTYILSPKKYAFDGDVLLYGNKIGLFTFGGKGLSVLIESPQLAQTIRELFKLAAGNPSLTEKKGPQE